MQQMKRRTVAVLIAMMLLLSSFTVMATEETLTVAAGDTYLVAATMALNDLTIEEGGALAAAEGYLLTMVVDGEEKAIKPGSYSGNVALVLTEDYSHAPIGSLDARGGDDYRAAIYVDADGLNEDRSVSQAVVDGSVDGTTAEGFTITSSSENFNGIIVEGVDYTISDATLILDGQGDAIDENGEHNVSDFTGLGAGIMALDDAKVTMDQVDIEMSGVGRLTLLTDSGADTLIQDSAISVAGGDLYEGYINNADFRYMVAPPWVLGIAGDARGTNLMGEDSTAAFVRVDAKADQWGVLSIDTGSDMVMTVVDSTLTLEGEGQTGDPFSENYGSGYGTYIIGNAKSYFYGVTFNVGTYASILTEGEGYYGSSNFADPIGVYPLEKVYTGEKAYDWMGNEYDDYYTVHSEEAVFEGITGLGNNTVINSDAFAFMAHNDGKLTVTDNTVVNTDNATFLMKAGSVDMVVSDGAQLNSEEGVILQIIDNDDRLVGLDMSIEGIMPAFATTYHEDAGYPGIDYAIEVVTEGRDTYNFTATDVSLMGHIYNGSGNLGGQAGDVLNVVLGSGADLTGDISSTSVVHVDEYGEQMTDFTINEYYYLGHVANRAYYNGGNDIAVSLENGASWTVEGTSLINSLTIDETSMLDAKDGKSLTVYVDGDKQAIEAGTSYSLQGEIALIVSDHTMPESIGSVDAETLMILVENTSNPELWIEFIDKYQDDATGQWLSELLKKIAS